MRLRTRPPLLTYLLTLFSAPLPNTYQRYISSFIKTMGGCLFFFPSAKCRVGQGDLRAMKWDMMSVSDCMWWFKEEAILPKMRPNTHTLVTCTLSLSVYSG